MASAIMAHVPEPALNLIGTTNTWQCQQLNQQTEVGRGLNGSFVIFEVSGLASDSSLCAVRVSLLAVKNNEEEIFITRADIPAVVLHEQQQGALVHCPSPADIDDRTHVQVNWIAFTRNDYGNALFIVNEGSLTKKNKTNGATGKFLRVRLEVVCNGGQQHLLNQVDIRWQSNLSNGRKEAHRENLAHFRVAYNLHAARHIRHVLEHGTMDPSSPTDKMGNLKYLLEHAHTATEYVAQQQPETHLNGDVFLLDTLQSFLPRRAPTSRSQLAFATTEGGCYQKQDTSVLSARPGSIDDANEAFKGTLARGHVSAIGSDAPPADPSDDVRAWLASVGQEGAPTEDDFNFNLDDLLSPETPLPQAEDFQSEVLQSEVLQSEVLQSEDLQTEVLQSEDYTYQEQEDLSQFMPDTSHSEDREMGTEVVLGDLHLPDLEEGSYQEFEFNRSSETHETQDVLVDVNLEGMENLDDENEDSSSLKRARDDDAELEDANNHKRFRNCE